MADNISVTKVMDPRLRTEPDNEYIAVIGADNWSSTGLEPLLSPTHRWPSTTLSQQERGS